MLVPLLILTLQPIDNSTFHAYSLPSKEAFCPLSKTMRNTRKSRRKNPPTRTPILHPSSSTTENPETTHTPTKASSPILSLWILFCKHKLQKNPQELSTSLPHTSSYHCKPSTTSTTSSDGFHPHHHHQPPAHTVPVSKPSLYRNSIILLLNPDLTESPRPSNSSRQQIHSKPLLSVIITTIDHCSPKP